MSEGTESATILYKCPYCVKGRFTAADGWDGAVRHIRDNHTSPTRRKRRVKSRQSTGDVLPGEEEVCYPGGDFAMPPA
jgi:hypothetical protein